MTARRQDDIRARRLKNGRVVYDIYFTVNGRKAGKRGFPTKGEARAHKRRALVDAERDVYVPSSHVTFGQYLNRWLDARAPGTTTDLYKRWLRPWLLETTFRLPGGRPIADVKLQRLQPEDLGALYRWLQTEGGLSANTVRLLHTVVKLALRDAVQNGHVARNAAVLANKSVPKGVKTEIHPYSTDEAKAFLKAASDDRLYALWRLYMTVGLRRGEGLQLQWRDVDLETGDLVVCRGGSSGSTKTGRTRTWKLDPKTVAILRAHRKAHLAERAATEGLSLPAPDGLVFTREDGRPIDVRTLARDHVDIEKRAGIGEHRTIHDLRHTAATQALAKGAHFKVVQEMLGHASFGITMDVYSHLVPSMKSDAADLIAAAYDD